MATPPHEFADTGDIPDPTRSILEPVPRVDSIPAPRVVLKGAPTGPTDNDPELRQRHPDVDSATGNGAASRRGVVPPPSHHSIEPILDSLPPWVGRLGDGSWPAIRSDQFWGFIAIILLSVLVVLAVQRGPVFPSSSLVESGAPGSEAEDPAGPGAEDAELSATARSSERLGQPTDDEGDAVQSEPAADPSTKSRAKTFSHGGRKMQTAATPPGDGDRDNIDFEPEDGSGDDEDENDRLDGAPGAGNGDGTPTTVHAGGRTVRSDPGTGAVSSSTSRRSTILISSGSPTTRPTSTTTSTTRFVIITDHTTTSRASSTATTRSTTSSSTTESTETTQWTTTTKGSSSTSSTASITTTTAATSSTTGSTTTPSSAPEPEEPEPDP